MTLNSQVFLDEKAKTLGALNDFFGYGFTPEEIKETLEGPLLQTHAKENQTPFSPEDRAKEKRETLKNYGDQIESAISWAREIGLYFESL